MGPTRTRIPTPAKTVIDLVDEPIAAPPQEIGWASRPARPQAAAQNPPAEDEEAAEPNPFYIDDTETVAVLLDMSHLYYCTRLLGRDFSYEKLAPHISNLARLSSLNLWLDRVRSEDPAEHDPTRGVINFCKYNGYRTTVIEGKEETDRDGRRRQPNTDKLHRMGLWMADVVHKPNPPDHLILFAGAAHLACYISYVQSFNTRVTVASVLSLVDDEVRSAADRFVDLSECSFLMGVPREPRAGASGRRSMPVRETAPAEAIPRRRPSLIDS